MRLLLDTHVVLWLLTDRKRVGDRARQALYGADVNLVSVIAFVEIGIKQGLGKLMAPQNLRQSVPDERVLQIRPEHGLALTALPRHHRDPFDRLLIAQAQAEGLTIVSADAVFADYDVPLVDARH